MSALTTIAALATAPAPAGIAVIRVSGPETRRALKALFRSHQSPVEEPRRLIFGQLVDHASGAAIDHALAVYMPNPYSFTGEDVAEFQFHGSPLIVKKMLRSLFAFGVTPAEPGEFSKRAFLNGKMDLVQAESICELIEASSEQALKIASEHLSGRFSQVIAEIGEPLRDALAEVEASIDFPDEDISPQSTKQIRDTLVTCRHVVEHLLETYNFGTVVREGYRVLLCGPPNAGKSSLLNLLLGRERAIVTEVSGTTRNLIEEEATLAGHRFVFCDSAGLVETEDTVEKIGVELAKERLPWADLVLFVVDSTDKSQAWTDILPEIREKAGNIWMVINKIDLNPDAIGKIYCEPDTCRQNFYISVRTGDGGDNLTSALVNEIEKVRSDSGETSQVVTNERHRDCLLRALNALTRVEEAYEKNLPSEIIAAELRGALTALEEIIGRTFTEDILGRIFSKFCIGK